MVFFFSSRRRHTRYWRDWSSDVCSSDLDGAHGVLRHLTARGVRVEAGAEQQLGAVHVADAADHALIHEEKADRLGRAARSEERRVGEEGRTRGWPDS